MGLNLGSMNIRSLITSLIIFVLTALPAVSGPLIVKSTYVYAQASNDWVTARVDFKKVFQNDQQFENVVGFGLDGSFSKRKIHAIRLDGTTFSQGVPTRLSYKNQIGRFFIDEGSVRDGRLKTLYQNLNKHDQIILKSLCSTLSDDKFVQKLFFEIYEKLPKGSTKVYFTRKQSSFEVKALAQKCSSAIGKSEFTFVRSEEPSVNKAVNVSAQSASGTGTSCFEKPELCEKTILCNLAVEFKKSKLIWTANPFYSKYVTEANKRGLTCNVEVIDKPLKLAFINSNSEDRRTVQYELSKLGLYTSTIDGLYGTKTEAALTQYNKNFFSGEELDNESNANKLMSALLTLNTEKKPLTRPYGKGETCQSNPEKCSLVELCDSAVAQHGASKQWSKTNVDQPYVEHAKLSGVQCGVEKEAVVVAALPTCSTDASKCSVTELCMQATLTVEGKRKWSTAAEAGTYIETAKLSGLQCGVEREAVIVAALPACETDVTKCSVFEMCQRATQTVDGKRKWSAGAEATAFIEAAKLSGVQCGVEKEAVVVAALPTCSTDASKCSVTELCMQATQTVEGKRKWNSVGTALPYIEAAKLSGLQCGVEREAVVVAALPTCETDATKCSVFEMCQRATSLVDDVKAWSPDPQAKGYIEMAQQSGLACGVPEKKVVVAQAVVPQGCDADPVKCTLPELCTKVVSFETGMLNWTTNPAYLGHIEFVQRMGMSCGIANTAPAVPAVVVAEPEPEPAAPKVMQFPNRKALVIGNSNYANANPLKNPINDAKAVAEKLTKIGFEVTLELDLGGREMIRALSSFKSKVSSADISLFYFAGHGVELDKQNYLVPVDATMTDTDLAKFETIPLNNIMAAGSQAKELSMVLIDACRDNPFAANLSKTRSGGRGLAIVERVNETVDTIISFAAASGDVAEDGSGANSPYAEAIIDIIDEPNLEVGFLFRKLRDRVIEKTNGRQKPETVQQLSGDAIYLVSK